MKKINIKTKLEKYKIDNLNKKNLLLIALFLNISIILWCIIELIQISIYELIIATVIFDGLLIAIYNIYAKAKIRIDCKGYIIDNNKHYCLKISEVLINQCISCKKFVNKPFLE